MKTMRFVFPIILLLSSCSQRCIPFKDWGPAVYRSQEKFKACIQPNIECEKRQRADKKVKCIWNDCPLATDYEKLASGAGYPGYKLVCENDCGLSILNFCIYSGRQNSAEAIPELKKALEEFE